MDEVYTCICKGQQWSIHDGFIRCANCKKEYKFKRIIDLKGRERIDLECVTDFNERAKKEE